MFVCAYGCEREYTCACVRARLFVSLFTLVCVHSAKHCTCVIKSVFVLVADDKITLMFKEK